MTDSKKTSLVSIIFAIVFIAVGVGVFAIRLTHPGPYAMPGGVAPFAAAALLFSAGLLLWQNKPRFLGWIILVISPVLLFPAIYSIMGESEETISLYAENSNNEPVDLRLWIVDREDGAWVGMPRSKAIEHSLDGARLTMLRKGEIVCVIPSLTKDSATTQEIHAMKVEKYSVAQIAGAIGMYPLEATENTAALRLDPCPS